jgi:uncharacterized Zn finger protein
MGWGRWDRWDTPRMSSARRRVATDGIATKKKRGAEYTWWSKRFVSVLESFGSASRLHRGRSYARTGQVMHLVVAPGLVTASVQGSRSSPYQVRIAITALTPQEWAAVDDALAGQALYAAALLAGEMPREIEDVFARIGHPLFPSRSSDVETDCSCPDYANPCKHVAAVYYVLAERFDDDPFSILAWRGRGREALMASLRARRTATEEAAPEVAPVPSALNLATFWDAAPEALALRFRPDVDGAADAMVRLGPLVSGGMDVVAALGPSWKAIGPRAMKRALEE